MADHGEEVLTIVVGLVFVDLPAPRDTVATRGPTGCTLGLGECAVLFHSVEPVCGAVSAIDGGG